jgi:serine O-acetyltransferase
VTAQAEQEDQRRAFWQRVHASQPRFFEAVAADASITARYRGERSVFRGRLDTVLQVLRLAWASDAFLAHMIYRAKARMQALGVPILPRIAHRMAIVIAQVAIGDPVIMAPGVYIAHGQVVIDGITEIASGVVIAPFVSIGLRAGSLAGPTIEQDAQIGTGSRLLGPLRVGAGAQVGANAVVLEDVPAATTVVGAPARPV